MNRESTLDRDCKRNLIISALEAREKAYAPYSGYRVGAALLTKTGEIFTGCNIENASYGATICAERSAFVSAIMAGHMEFCMIAVVGGIQDEPEGYAYPCGICRQVMQEFCKAEFRILVGKTIDDYKELSLQELFPYGFEL